MKHITSTLPLIGFLVLAGSHARAQVQSTSLTCQQISIGSELPSTANLPPLIFCGPTDIASLSQEGSQNLDQSSLLEDVISASPTVQSYKLQLKSSEYSLKSSKGSWWPSVSMSNSSVLFTDILSAQNYGGTPTTPSSPATAGKGFNPFNGSSLRDGFRGRSSSELTGWTESYSNYTQAYPVITIQWNFLDPSRYPQIAAAKHQLELSKSQLLQATQEKRTQILLTYGDFLFAGFQIAEVSRLVDLQRQIVTEANNRVKLKLLPRFQADQEFRTLLSYQTQLQSLRIQQLNANVALQSLLSPIKDGDSKQLDALTPAFSPLALHDILAPALKPWPLDDRETVKRSLAHSESLKQLMLQSRIATDNANEQWGGILPTIGFLGYMTYQYTAGSQNYAPPTQPSGAASSTLSNYAGLSISWNIFDGYATRNQAKSYEQTAASYKAQYLDAATQLKTQTLENLNQLVGNNELLVLSLKDLTSAEQIAADTKARSTVGLAEQYDVINSEMETHQSRLQLIQALAAYVKSYEQLKGLVGHASDPT